MTSVITKIGIGHNGPPAEDTPIHRIRGAEIMIARGTVHGITALTWAVMCEVAVKEKGDRYWKARKRTAEHVGRLRGQPVDPSSINRAWHRLLHLGLISDTGKKDVNTGATIWQLNPEPALQAYAELKHILENPLH